MRRGCDLAPWDYLLFLLNPLLLDRRLQASCARLGPPSAGAAREEAPPPAGLFSRTFSLVRSTRRSCPLQRDDRLSPPRQTLTDLGRQHTPYRLFR